MVKSERLKIEAEQRILVLDGAMGTMIQAEELTEEDFHDDSIQEVLEPVTVPLKGCNDILCLTRPDLIYDIHCRYLEAGADIVTTNSFNANPISLADYMVESLTYDINAAAAELARQAVAEFEMRDERARFVAGSIGPTNKTLSLSPKVEDPGYRDLTFHELAAGYREQIRGLVEGGADLLMIETVFDTLNAKAALYAAGEVFEELETELPVMVSGTVSDASGRLLAGQTPEAFAVSLEHAHPFSIGLNCSLGATELRAHIENLAPAVSTFVSVHPNAGLPNTHGDYTQSAGEMASILREFIDAGLVNIIGGCCGTTPEHTRMLAETARGAAPRKVPDPSPATRLSGLEALIINEEMNFINIGERTNVAGSRKFARLIREKNYEEAVAIAKEQVEFGAQVIDVCMDDALLDGGKAMTEFLNLAAAEPDICRVPFMIDSSDWSIVEKGLSCLQGKGIVNSISLKEGEAAMLEKAALLKRYGAAVVVMLFDEQGQAADFNRKIAIAERSYMLLTEKAGFLPQDIIFDPNVLAVATGIPEHDCYGIDFIRAAAWIREKYPLVRISGGVSNLSFSFRGANELREAMHSAFLYHAIRAGMDMGILNPAMVTLYDEIPEDLLKLVEDVVLARNPDSGQDLVNRAEEIVERGSSGGKKRVENLEWREGSAEERLTYALMRGIPKYIGKDLEEARLAAKAEGLPALSLIEGPLMAGMNIVGERFGAGKMFLPQVVKSARVMKKAVSLLEPFVSSERAGEHSSAGKILLATVRGDVHDIGKNIVSVILACNNFEIIDLGVMVEPTDIADTAERERVDIIGLSGLITPSLHEMVHTVNEINRRHLHVPILIGGAATSVEHTALYIEPESRNPVIHVADASTAVRVVSELISSDLRASFVKAAAERYGQIREEESEKEKHSKPMISLEESRRRRYHIPDISELVAPKTVGVTIFDQWTIEDVIPLINWRMLFHAWKLPFSSPEAAELKEDALRLLRAAGKRGNFQPKVGIGIYPALRDGDDVVICDPETRAEELTRFTFLRQQRDYESTMSLADFIDVPGDDGLPRDYFGIFSATAGEGTAREIAYYEERGELYEALLFQAASDRTAEALAELGHRELRQNLWGYEERTEIDPQEIIAGHYKGIRPAPGYPICPDHTEKAKIIPLLGGEEKTGVHLTETYVMDPPASECGYIVGRAESSYFSVGKIDDDQLADYAERKGWSRETAEMWMAPVLLHPKRSR